MEEQLKKINEEIQKTEKELAEKKKKLEELKKIAEVENSEKEKLRKREDIKIEKYAGIFKKRNVRCKCACPVCGSICAIPDLEKKSGYLGGNYYCTNDGCVHYYYTEDCCGGMSERAKSSNKPLYKGDLTRKVFWD